MFSARNILSITLTLISVGVLLPGAANAIDDARVNRDADRVIQLEFRVKQLERKVAGMQKQITILHAKKEDKKPAAVPLVDSNTNETGYWQTFTTNPPTTEGVKK